MAARVIVVTEEVTRRLAIFVRSDLHAMMPFKMKHGLVQRKGRGTIVGTLGAWNVDMTTARCAAAVLVFSSVASKARELVRCPDEAIQPDASFVGSQSLGLEQKPLTTDQDAPRLSAVAPAPAPARGTLRAEPVAVAWSCSRKGHGLTTAFAVWRRQREDNPPRADLRRWG